MCGDVRKDGVALMKKRIESGASGALKLGEVAYK
jgi:hypothetical protein